jgi:biopolymer transport protein ExbB
VAHHAKFGAAKLEETGSEQEFLTRTIKKVLDEETTSLENGLTMLATIGATAPSSACSARCGASITRWWRSAYRARACSTRWRARSATLIMTGIGLAVALPAVMGYNWLTRSNRVLTAKLDAGTRRQVGQRAARRRKPVTRETSSCTETSL